MACPYSVALSAIFCLMVLISELIAARYVSVALCGKCLYIIDAYFIGKYRISCHGSCSHYVLFPI